MNTKEKELLEVKAKGQPARKESIWISILQVFPTFLIAGLGMVGAGLVLNKVQRWEVFTEVKEIMIMVPPLIGLKGNLEMTLAARLSTAANCGHMDRRKEAISLIFGNLILVQCQGIVVGFLASLVGMVMGWAPVGKLDYDQGLLMSAAAVVTASLASFALGSIMIIVILIARQLNVNPDNVATPIAASLGDVTTLGLLAWIAEILYRHLQAGLFTSHIIIGGYFLILPMFLYLAWNNKHTVEVLQTGWTPVVMAMLISTGGGAILDKAVEHFSMITVFAPVMNGAGGNLVAIQASRMTTYLHAATNSLLGTFPSGEDVGACVLPCTVICGGIQKCAPDRPAPHSRFSRILLVLLLPGQIIFVYCICMLRASTTPTPLFLFFYCVASLLQVFILLYLCQILVNWMWSRGSDPDNAAIPYLTAIGDLLGTGFLTIAFILLQVLNDETLIELETGHTNSTLLAEMTQMSNQTIITTLGPL
jgi:solute carrier family 41